MGMHNTLSKLRERKGVIGVFVLSEEERQELVRAEGGIITSGGMVYENRALKASTQKEAAICVFSHGFLEESRDILVEMADNEGHIYGHDVPKNMRTREFPNGVWISDDFVVYSNPIPKEEPHIVVLPQRLSFLGQDEGVSDSVAF
ncbi:MAG: hypothetical protein PHT00_01755 [Candidatus Methanomethylophilus sp.]|nr:hypothetical protein [Methanomethylophilus sp.]MDD4222478.1 hypothetical protein [Methanomethylophilus sp.]